MQLLVGRITHRFEEGKAKLPDRSIIASSIAANNSVSKGERETNINIMVISSLLSL